MNKKYAQKSKQVYFEEKVRIVKIFTTEYTRGLSRSLENAIIVKINEQNILNLREAIDVLEQNKDALHKILTKNGSTLYIKNLNKSENDAILKKHKILMDRSEDLCEERVIPFCSPEYNYFTPAYSMDKDLKLLEKNSEKKPKKRNFDNNYAVDIKNRFWPY